MYPKQGEKNRAKITILSNLNVLDSGENKSVVETPHGGDEAADEALVVGGHDFITNSNIIDPCLGVERSDVGGDPLARVGEDREGGDVKVADGDSDGDATVGKGPEDVRVGVEDLDAVDDGLGLEEVDHLGWRWKVVSKSAVVDADRVCGDGEIEEESGEDEDGVRERHGFCRLGDKDRKEGDCGVFIVAGREDYDWVFFFCG